MMLHREAEAELDALTPHRRFEICSALVVAEWQGLSSELIRAERLPNEMWKIVAGDLVSFGVLRRNARFVLFCVGELSNEDRLYGVAKQRAKDRRRR
jgi:hypothetical protein